MIFAFVEGSWFESFWWLFAAPSLSLARWFKERATTLFEQTRLDFSKMLTFIVNVTCFCHWKDHILLVSCLCCFLKGSWCSQSQPEGLWYKKPPRGPTGKVEEGWRIFDPLLQSPGLFLVSAAKEKSLEARAWSSPSKKSKRFAEFWFALFIFCRWKKWGWWFFWGLESPSAPSPFPYVWDLSFRFQPPHNHSSPVGQGPFLFPFEILWGLKWRYLKSLFAGYRHVIIYK